MKFLLSILTARPLNLLLPAVLLAVISMPFQALASREMRIGNDHTGGTEGDPLDTNDFGGGGGWDHVHDQVDGSPADSGFLPFDLSSIPVLLVPEFQGGQLFFRVIFVDKASEDPSAVILEGSHAP